MKKVLMMLLLVCSVWAINSCNDDSNTTEPSTDVTYDEIKNLPNSFSCTITEGSYQWILNPPTYSAQMTANGISIIGERESDEGKTVLAMTVPLRKGSGLSTLASITINKSEPSQLYRFTSNSMKVYYTMRFCCDSLIYGTFYASATNKAGAQVTVTNGTFKINVKPNC